MVVVVVEGVEAELGTLPSAWPSVDESSDDALVVMELSMVSRRFVGRADAGGAGAGV